MFYEDAIEGKKDVLEKIANVINNGDGVITGAAPTAIYNILLGN